MATDEHGLLLQVSADITKLERAFARAQGVVGERCASMERRAQESGSRLAKLFGETNVGEALDRVFSRARLGVIEEGGAKIPIFGAALEGLGPDRRRRRGSARNRPGEIQGGVGIRR
jgi:hypothetical protein